MSDPITLPLHIRACFQRAAGASGPQVYQAWASAFGADPSDPKVLELVGGMASDLQRLELAVQALSQHGAAKKVAANALVHLRQFVVLPGVFQLTVTNLRAAEAKAAIDHLTFIDALVPSEIQRDIPEEQRASFGEELAALIALIDAADMPLQLKHLVREHLARLQWAIGAFDLVGIEGVSRILGTTFAELSRVAPAVANTGPKGQNILAKTKKVVKGLSDAIQWAGKINAGVNTLQDWSGGISVMLEGPGEMADVTSAATAPEGP